MCVHIYLFMYIYIYMYTHMYIYTCIYAYICLYICVCMNITYTHTLYIHLFICMYIYMFMYSAGEQFFLWFVCSYTNARDPLPPYCYGVAMMSRLLETKGLFCRISSLLQFSFAKETYNYKEPTNARDLLPLL